MILYRRDNGAYILHRIYRVTPDDYWLVTAVRRKEKLLQPGSFWWDFFEKVWIRMIPLRPMGNRIYRLLQGRRSAHRENEREKT